MKEVKKLNRFLVEANEMKETIISNRRYIHQNAEVGFKLPKTIAYVSQKLKDIGYEPKTLGGGLTCTVGTGSPVLLLRADMDALPQLEMSGESFASETGACHSCGHDGHTAMMLAAAEILKKHEEELEGTVKFMFQAAEETLKGSQAMIDEGILTEPDVDAAMAFHLNFGPCGDFDLHPGCLTYAEHKMMPSADEFQITVKGKSCHSSTAFLGVSAVSAAAHIIIALQELIQAEFPSDETVLLAIGQMISGSTSNIIPDEAIIKGNFRAYTNESRDKLRERLTEISTLVAQTFRATAEVEILAGVAPNINHPAFAKEMAGYCEDVMNKVIVIPPVKGSEDFANLCKHVPTFFANVCAGSPEDGYEYSMHHPKARIDEHALPYGAAALCNCAYNWLKNH